MAAAKKPKSDPVGRQVRVESSGQMAQMWETTSKPLLPRMAKTFADRLKAEIEQLTPSAPAAVVSSSLVTALANRLRNLWWAVLGSPTEMSSRRGRHLQGVRQRDTMIATIDSFNQLLPTGLKLEIKSVTAAGSTVAVEFEGNATTAEGRPYHNQYCMVFMLANGKIEQVNEYFCNAHADEVLWALVDQ